jgi:hypothetical protein
MNDETIAAALGDIGGESDPTLKNLKLASLVSAVFRERGVELVLVGGSAIEFYTDGAYVSGDVDLCLLTPPRLDVPTRQRLMARLSGVGGPRNWQVAGAYVDILGELETSAQTPLQEQDGPYGRFKIVQPEDLLVERVLVSVYPHLHPPARECARKLAAVALDGTLEMNWREVARIASLPAYGNLAECRDMVGEIACELEIKNPLDPA